MILGFLGQPRSGKTLLLTYWLKRFYDSGYLIVSNYRLGFPHEHFRIDVIDQMLNDPSFQAKYANLSEYYGAEKIVVAIDEIASQMDSRTALRKENILLSYLLMQAGKRDITIGWTAQLPDSVDKRLKGLSEFVTFAERQLDENRNLLGFNYVQVDMYHKREKRFSLSLKNAERLFDLYNTREFVRAQFLKKKEK